MSEQNTTLSGTQVSARMLTTLLVSCWGLSFAYLLLHSLLITHNIGLCLAASVPMLIVWATLERKRWGRLALLGVCATTLGLFFTLVALFAVSGESWLVPAERNLTNYSHIALSIVSQNSYTAAVMLTLSAATGYWLKRPVVVHEFEQGKRSGLAAGQRVIAIALVGTWGAAAFSLPIYALTKPVIIAAFEKNGIVHSSAYVPHFVVHKVIVSSLATRSEASANSR